MQHIDIDQLSNVIGGASPSAKWEEIRTAAQPHCPETVARFTRPPANRAQAQRIGNACLAEMGSFKATFARPVIDQAIDSAFPNR